MQSPYINLAIHHQADLGAVNDRARDMAQVAECKATLDKLLAQLTALVNMHFPLDGSRDNAGALIYVEDMQTDGMGLIGIVTSKINSEESAK